VSCPSVVEAYSSVPCPPAHPHEGVASGGLPFTGLDLVLVVSLALALIALGLLLRRVSP
jgi:hypothetical protein